ncbi:hypothetical protein ACFFWD_30070 [Bradyrhizobium erythrophlei]|uniref:hypothetical protein n=1 Tax=Bradyrhizobium erythrophlei TaxID=1437360 RepID=UPI0035E754BE
MADHNGPPYDQRWLTLSFATNPEGQRVSRFSLAIYSRDFVEPARMMVETDPKAAIQAFGAAMQVAEIERRQPTETDEAAA